MDKQLATIQTVRLRCSHHIRRHYGSRRGQTETFGRQNFGLLLLDILLLFSSIPPSPSSVVFILFLFFYLSFDDILEYLSFCTLSLSPYILASCSLRRDSLRNANKKLDFLYTKRVCVCRSLHTLHGCQDFPEKTRNFEILSLSLVGIQDVNRNPSLLR
ncbi:hypothetical protein WDU94_005763 [Cyamophila willieti]